jgi:TPR repeat protein
MPRTFTPRRKQREQNEVVPENEKSFEEGIKWERGEKTIGPVDCIVVCLESIKNCLMWIPRRLWWLYLYYWKHIYYRQAQKAHDKAAKHQYTHARVHLAFLYFHGVGMTYSEYSKTHKERMKKGAEQLKQATLEYGEKIWKEPPPKKGLCLFYTHFCDCFDWECLRYKTREKLKEGVCIDDLIFMAGVLMEPRNPCYNQCLATMLFRIAHEEDEPEGTFWYGRALLSGLGVERDHELGFQYIERAATRGVRRALFELGMIYEHGYGDEASSFGKKNLPFALVYYEAVAARPPPAHYHELIDDFEQIQPLLNPDWHAVDQAIGQNIFSMMAWELAGQAFLFAAAATLSLATEVQHYALLFFFLPVIGMFVSISSIITTREVMHQNGDKGHSLLIKVWIAKKSACKALVGESFYGKSNLERASDLSWLSGWFCLWLNILFLGTWITLLVTESIWWASAGATPIVPSGNDVRDAINRSHW